MMPETSNATRIEVFSARQFPSEWTPEAVLFESVHAVDATLVSVEGRWWLFTNVSPHPAIRNYDELHAFHGPTPLGPWTPHRRNPVKSDARSARGAGRFFWKGQTLFRPSQDCSGRYGSAIVINRVDRLTPDAFQETMVGRVEPHWRSGLTGTHTLNSCAGLTVVDFRIAREMTRSRVNPLAPELHSPLLGERNMFTMNARAVCSVAAKPRNYARDRENFPARQLRMSSRTL